MIGFVVCSMCRSGNKSERVRGAAGAVGSLEVTVAPFFIPFILLLKPSIYILQTSHYFGSFAVSARNWKGIIFILGIFAQLPRQIRARAFLH